MIDQERRTEYMQERMLLVQMESDSYKSFGQSLLLVTTGALALSVTFVTSLEIETDFDLALIAWLFWVCSITFQLVSKIWSGKSLAEQQLIISEFYENKIDFYRKNPYNSTVHSFNAYSLSSFVIAAVVFLVFIYRTLNF